MSTGEESYASRDDGTSRPSFELALRGYDKRQVDRYVEQMDGALSTLTADRAQAAGQIQGLTTHIQRLQAELTELRQRPAQVDRASFRDLGPMVGPDPRTGREAGRGDHRLRCRAREPAPG